MWLKTIFIAFVLTAVFGEDFVPGECPEGCYCSEKVVDCSALMEFPLSLPADTVTFKVSHLNVIEIPSYAFSYLENITRVELTNCNVANVKAFAFYGAKNLRQIIFDKTVIRNLESYCFMGLQDIHTLQFSNARVDRIKPFAFYKISNTGSLTFDNTHVRYINSHGFFNCSGIKMFTMINSNISDVATGAFTEVEDVKMFLVRGNHFWNMRCGVISDMANMTEKLFFQSNTFYCNCSINWLLKDEGSKFAFYRGFSECHGPDNLVNVSLTEVNLQELSCTVQPGEGECIRDTLIPRPKLDYTKPGVDGGDNSNKGNVNGKNTGGNPKDAGNSLQTNFIVILVACVFSLVNFL